MIDENLQKRGWMGAIFCVCLCLMSQHIRDDILYICKMPIYVIHMAESKVYVLGERLSLGHYHYGLLEDKRVLCYI